ncbi:hypothetical protein [Streptomyces sp. RKAG293]|uniref:hypothetical protein n=1 Tax=Streptomyces sp. RKAG293 TaxID=2893403 RepID=UPI0020338CA4|nr:hypothetical protein [Streptomyces sp. RKAG293]MCM2424273.1 hypothetical protein [Streptomyces sp. RKAG293]
MLSISAVLLLLLVVALLVRKFGLRIPHALASALLGFYAASSSWGPSITSFLSKLAAMLGHFSP